ncbi:MAG: hypothetical protein ACXW4U_16625, partial [Anaerolineales bacterium]
MSIRIILIVSALLLSACLPASTPPNQTLIPPTVTVVVPADTVVPSTPVGNGPTIANCPMFPADNIWNARVDSLPAHPLSDAWIESIGRDEGFHMDFGSGEWDGGPIGIPFNVISGSTVNKYTVEFDYPDESDLGPYPIP